MREAPQTGNQRSSCATLIFVHKLLLSLATLLSLGCGGSPYGDFSDVPERESCTVQIAIPNMACGEACPPKVSSALQRVSGVRSVEVDYEGRSAVVEAVAPACSGPGFERMIANLHSRGYRATIVRSFTGRESQAGGLGWH